MFRLFSYLAAVSCFLLLVCSAGIMQIATRAIGQAEEDAVKAAALGIQLSISAKLELIGGSLDKMAQDAETVQAAAAQNPEAMRAAALKLAAHLPHARAVRLLPPGVTELDDKTSPPMTYADLNMVRETVSSGQNPLPAIQGDSPGNRHLAMARKIVQEKQVIGVLLASFDDAFIVTSLSKAGLENGYVTLQQGKLTLGAAGSAQNGEDDGRLQLPIAGTSWRLSYGMTRAPLTLDTGLMTSLLLSALGGTLAAFLFAYRLLSKMLLEDLRSAMRAFKDMMKNNFQGNYATKLNEMKGFIFTLSQYKRVLDRDNTSAKTAPGETDDDFDFSGFSPNTVDLKAEDKPQKRVSKAPALKIAKKEGPVFKKPAKPAEPPPSTAKSTADKAPALTKTKEQPKGEIPFAAPPANDAHDGIFRAYDIRGIVDKTLTKTLVYDIGRALGSEAQALRCNTIALARDGRLSSPAFASALAQGIVTTGCDVLDIGMVPTPVLYFVSHHLADKTGAVITGSHNPADYNGVKMVVKGETLASERIQQIKERIGRQDFFTASTPGTIENNERYVNDYIGTIEDDVHLGRPMKVVVDCGNGVAGDIAPKLLRTLGCEVIELYCEINGEFPNHHPDPSRPENLQELIMAVKHYQADLGLAFDGDGDRLGVVDSGGKIIWPDRQMMLFAENVLARHPGAEIIYDVKCSRQLPRYIEKRGGRPTLWKTGHSLMKAKLQETGAALAGEMSGHIFFNDRWFGFDDALYSAARLIEIVSEDTRSSAEIFAALPDSISTPELQVMLGEGENFKIIEQLINTAAFADAEVTTLDGLRVEFADGFGLVRASNTTPCLTCRFEADSRQALKTIQERFAQLLKTVKPDISLPF